MHKTKKILRLTILIGFAMAMVACHSGERANQANTDTICDDYGRKVVVPTHPQRVVSVSPAVTEIIYALGAQDILMARTDFCTFPPEVERLPSIGGISNLNIERILSFNPDLIISGSMVSKKVTDQLDAMGIPIVCVIEKPSFNALYDNIKAIGNLVGKSAEADSLNQELRQRVSTIGSPQGDEASCYYVVGYGASGNFTAGGNTFINDIIRMAGGRNIAEEISGWSYSLEALMKNDPDFIIVRREDSANFVKTKPYTQLNAVRNGHVIGIESSMLDLQVPRNIDAVLFLRKQINTKSY